MITFVLGFQDWQWAVGTGVWIDDIVEQVAAAQAGVQQQVRRTFLYIGGITLMADVTQMPENAFGYVPTPALVAPIEFTLRRSDYAALGGHMDYVVPLSDALSGVPGRQSDHVLAGRRDVGRRGDTPWPVQPLTGQQK